MNGLTKHVARFLGARTFSTTFKTNMRLVQFTKGPAGGYKSIGVLKEDGSVVDLLSSNYKFPNNMVDFLAGGQDMMDAATKCLSGTSTPASEIKILSPITKCEKVICVGMNYKDHCAEQNMPVPEEPVIFSKFPSSIVGDGDAIVLPKESNTVDWEVELAVIIGKTGRRIKEAEAFEYVAGYTVAHDVSAREWQMQKNGKQWLLGKTFDTFCPLGPALVTKDEIQDPHNLALKCLVNGNEVQNSTTGQLVFGVDTCIAWISKFCTLQPGDVILTGTPPGVGVFRKPPVYLKAGDVAVCEIEKIGKITNPVVNEE